jgi:hypothetical protein
MLGRRRDALVEVPKLLGAYIAAAGILEDRKGSPFRSARGHNGSVSSDKAMLTGCLARDRPRREIGLASPRRSAITPFAQPGSLPTSPTVARSSTGRDRGTPKPPHDKCP